MTESEWDAFLIAYSSELLNDTLLLDRAHIPDVVRTTGWLGYAPATDPQISAAECRIQRAFPPSLRSFYRVTNGWRLASNSIYDIRPVEEVDWMINTARHIYDSLESDLDNRADPDRPPDPDPNSDADFWYEQGVRVRRALVLNTTGDDALWILDPNVCTSSGEWAGGFHASWEPGTDWCADSFAQLFRDARSVFLELSRDL